MTERVLVLPRARVPGGCEFSGLRPVGATALGRLRAATAAFGSYVERPRAEDDPSLKQLIPYVVIRDGELTFLMERTTAGGDARLHAKASIGVGGHLNPVDLGADPIEAGLRREWSEELIAPWEPDVRLVGFLNDDSNAVGAVHLGIVFTVQAAGRPVAIRETAKLTGRFVTMNGLRGAWDRLETWSRLVAAELLGVHPDPTAGD